MMRSLSALMVLASVTLAGQKPAPPVPRKPSTQATQKNAGSIKGRVLDEAGQPFPNVIVNVSPLNGVYAERREIITDENGGFQADGLTRRPYTISCAAKGYVEDSDTSSEHHLVGEFVTLRLIKGGVITGAVTDSLNDPVVKAKVSAIRVRNADGRAVGVAGEWDDAETDDRGIYRIYGLESGSYLVVVKQIGKYQDNSLRNEAPVYYPSATRGGAQEVTVNRGAEAAGINITYRNERGHVISGRCTGNLGESDEAYLKLIRVDSGVVQQTDWEGYEKEGAFVLYGVPDGEYFLIAQNDYDEPSAASPPFRVSVRGSDVTGVELRLAPLGSIAGRVVMEASSKDSRKPECKPARETLIEEMVVRALRDTKTARKDRSASLFDTTAASAIDEKSDFLLQRLVPGQYHLGMELPNEDLYVADIYMRTAAGKVADAARTGLAVKSGESVTNITVKLRDGAAGIRGKVTGSGEQTNRLRAHLVPAERESQDDALRFAEARVQTDGGFVFANIAPGRYWLLLRPATEDETAVASHAAAWTAAGRAAVRREAEAIDAQIDLKPCQRVTDYSINYRQPARATKPAR